MSNNNILWSFLVLILVGTNSFTLISSHNLKKDVRFSRELEQRKINAARLSHRDIPAHLKIPPLMNGKGDLVGNLKKNQWSIVVLFEPNQCGSCLNEKQLWNKLHDQGTLPVYGVTYLNDATELTQFIRESGIRIPVYQDTAAAIGKWLLPQGVPVKLLVNSDLQVVLADYVRDDPEKRRDFDELLHYFIQKN